MSKNDIDKWEKLSNEYIKFKNFGTRFFNDAMKIEFKILVLKMIKLNLKACHDLWGWEIEDIKDMEYDLKYELKKDFGIMGSELKKYIDD